MMYADDKFPTPVLVRELDCIFQFKTDTAQWSSPEVDADKKVAMKDLLAMPVQYVAGHAAFLCA